MISCDFMPERQKIQKEVTKDTKYPGQEETDAERKCRSGRRGVLSDKVEKNRTADADMAAELHGLQVGEERRNTNASQTGESCLEAVWQQNH